MTGIPPQPRPGGTATRLIRQLLALAGPGAELVDCQEREWASATFSGARHRFNLHLALAGRDTALPPTLDSLPDHEFDLSGEIVADCSATYAPRRRDGEGRWSQPLSVEILTVTAD